MTRTRRADGPAKQPQRPTTPHAPLLPLLAVLLALAATVAPVRATPVAAASGALVLTTQSAYTVVPASRVVRVVVDVTARNEKPNVTSGGVVTRYFYDGFRIGVQPEARNVRATAAGVRLSVATTPRDRYLSVEVRFRSSLFYRQVTTVRVTFDLPAGKPRSTSEIRVGPAFVTFIAWPFGDGGTVKVTVPAEFTTDTTGADVTRATTTAGTILTSSTITDVAAWYLVVSADRPAALTNDPVTLAAGERVNVRAWPDDPAWKAEVGDLLTRGLPELVGAIGLDWPVSGELSIFEVHTPLLEGYAGIFIEGEDRIQISENLDDLTILHEASHAWFNGDLFSGRWINEGLADTYAAEALGRVGQPGSSPDSVDPSQASAVRLNAWSFPGRITDDATEASEAYGYNASWTAVRTVVNGIGINAMQKVLAAARDRQIAYAGAGTPEEVSGPADWRRLLDLLDEVGHSPIADTVFERWVVTPDQATALRARATAREAYAALVRDGRDWAAPLYIRSAMADWAFDQATSRMAEARTILRKRDELAAVAARLGVVAPAGGRTAYQTASDSLDAARTTVQGEIDAGTAVEAAGAAVAAPRDPFVAVGLLGETPDTALSAARAAFSQGSVDVAMADALAVSSVLAAAGDVGRARVAVAVGLGALALLVLVGIVIVGLVARRRRRLLAAASAGTAPTAPRSAAPTASYATLAAPDATPRAAIDRGDASVTEER